MLIRRQGEQGLNMEKIVKKCPHLSPDKILCAHPRAMRVGGKALSCQGLLSINLGCPLKEKKDEPVKN